MKFETGVRWPGYAFSGGNKWDDLRRAVADMRVDGDTMAVVLDTEKEADEARKAAQRYCLEILKCRSANWKMISTKRENTLYLRKVSTI